MEIIRKLMEAADYAELQLAILRLADKAGVISAAESDELAKSVRAKPMKKVRY